MDDPLYRQKRLEFVLSQMDKYSGSKEYVGNNIKVLCPFHSDSSPSGNVYIGSKLMPGTFSCWSCSDDRTRTWNEYASKVGLEPYGRFKPRVESSSSLHMDLSEELDDPGSTLTSYSSGKFKFYSIPPNKRWRSIPTNLLIELGGRLCIRWLEDYESWSTTKMIYFPVLVNNEQEGFFLARLRKEVDKPSYLLAKKKGTGWTKSKGLWPFDHSVNLMTDLRSRTIVLVEGQRDALRLLTNGIPTVCIFGTNGWSDSKTKILEAIGVNRVVLFFDGDCAGRGATNKIGPNIEPFIDVEIVDLCSIEGSPYLQFEDEKNPSRAAKDKGVELWDPGNCPQWIINDLKSKYF